MSTAFATDLPAGQHERRLGLARAGADSRAALAAKYGVSGTAITLARSGKNHAHVA